MTPAVVEGFRLSAQQQRLWTAAARGGRYLVQAVVWPDRPLPANAMAAAARAIVERHDALRMRFVPQPGTMTALQVASSIPAPLWRVVEAAGVPVVDAVADEARRDRETADPSGGSPLFTWVTGGAEQALIITMSALQADASSLVNIAHETLIRGVGDEPAGEDAPIQYTQFGEWQHELHAEDGDGRAFWRAQRDVAAAGEELGFQASGNEDAAFEPRTVAVPLSIEMASSIESASRALGVTPASWLFALWCVLQARTSGRWDAVVGVVGDGRKYDELTAAVGLFAQYLPVRVDLSPSLSFAATATQCHEELAAAAAWEEYFSPSHIDGWSGERSHFPIVFEWSDPVRTITAGRVSARVELRMSCIDRFVLRLRCGMDGGGLVAAIDFDSSVLSPSQAEAYARRLATLIDGALTTAESSLGSLPLLAADEQARLLAHESAPDTAVWHGGVHQLIAEQSRRTPEATAVVCDGAALTYAQLDRRARRLAGRLTQLGAGPESIVAVMVERSVDSMVAILGVLHAGAAYLPIEPSQPADRLAYMLRHAGVTIAVTERRGADALADVTALCVDDDSDEASASAVEPSCDIEPHNLAYVIYTSGSTGRPKGVAVEHGQLASYIEAIRVRLRLPAGASYATVSSFAADLGHTVIFPALVTGGCLHVLPHRCVSDADQFAAYMRAHDIACLKIVPSHLKALMSTAAPAAAMPSRCLVLGGEASRWELGDLLHRAAPHCRVINHYGPTETTVGVTTFDVEPAGDRLTDTIPIGRALPGSRAYVVDPWGGLAPEGARGELWIGGRGVARGYVGSPALTAARFVPDPFCADPGGRVYRTGDRVRRLPDGTLEFCGRVDHQVKLRGYRVELGEVETALRAVPGVGDAVVVVREEPETGPRLIGYVTAGDAGAPSPADIRSALATHLPEYMIPAALLVLPRLPLTRNGKIDRAALPEPATIDSAGERVPPRTEVEAVLAQIWADLLHLPEISVTANFFESGGHSLLATQVVSRIRSTFAVDVSLRALFDAPTIAGLAAIVEQARRGGDVPAIPPLTPLPPDADIPLSFAQQRMWFLDQLEPGTSSYNVADALRLRGPLDADALDAALTEVVRRHAVLRTTFVNDDGVPRAVVHEPAAVAMTRTAIAADLTAEQRELEVRALVEAEAHAPFDLGRGPLLRARLIRVAPDDHVLAVTRHHIVSDGWSTDILVRELSALYEAYAAGRPSPLEDLPAQYGDYAAWQRGWLQGEVLDRHLAYWRQQLADAVPLDLPKDHERRGRSPVPAREPVVLPREVAAALREVSRREGVTLFSTLLALFQAVLARRAGQQDVSVATPIAGRTHVAVEGLIGLFVNTLVLRTDLSGRPTFRQLLHRVREVMLQAHEHQSLPFERVVEELRPDREATAAPLCQAMFTLRDGAVQAAGSASVAITAFPLAMAAARFDLTLVMTAVDDRLAGVLEYDATVFDRSTIADISHDLERLATLTAADPDRVVASLELMSPADREALLAPRRVAVSPASGVASVVEVLAAHARARPGALALEADGTPLTYAELNAGTNQFARFLRARGARPEDRVGVCLERGSDLIVAMLGILKAGCAYVPIDPAQGAWRLRSVCASAAVSLVVAGRHAALALDEVGVIDIDDARAEIAGHDDGDLDDTPPPGQLAYVIFTSGTSAHPKGVAVPHEALAARGASIAAAKQIVATDRLLQFMSPTFDAFGDELYPALAAGACLLLARDVVRWAPAELLDACAARRVTVLTLPTAYWIQVVEEVTRRGCLPPGLRLTTVGGEALPAPAAETWMRIADGRSALMNVYGPTEATIIATTHNVPLTTEWPGGRVPVGRLIGDTSGYILDDNGVLVPVGVVGELYLGGEGLARGYLGEPALTAERFVPHPFGEPGARLYRTGDRMRRLRTGELDFVGRNDTQVKWRGYRIELGEIEAVALRHSGVLAAVALVRDDGPATRRLTLYVAGDVDTGDFRAWLSGLLPSYMCPSAVVVMDALPLTAHGKVDRRNLPPPPEDVVDTVQEPRTETERAVVALWARLLRCAAVPVDGHFFHLGGHSLLATQVVAQIGRQYGVRVPLQVLFEHPVAADFAATVDTLARSDGGMAEMPPITRVARAQMLELSYAQQRLWFLHQLEPGSPFYNSAASLKFHGPLDIAAMDRAIALVVERHEVLRTTFSYADGRPFQVIHAASGVPLRLTDLTAENDPVGEARRRAESEVRRPFDLERGPLMRVDVFRLAPDQHVLAVVFHHIVADGWSVNIMLREVSAAYEAAAAAGQAVLPPLAVQYADYAAWQRSWLAGETLESQLAYWREHLADLPDACELPPDRPRPPVQGHRGARRQHTVDVALSTRIRELGHVVGTTPFMTLLAAFQTLLHRYTGNDDVVVGTDIANRHHGVTEPLIGFFVNQLAMRADFSGDPSFRALLAQVRERALLAYAHQDLPFDRLVEALRPVRDLSRAPLFQIKFLLQDAAPSAAPFTNLRVESFDVPRHTAKFDITFAISDLGNQFGVMVEYNTDLYEDATIDRLIAHFVALLDGVTANPDLAVSRVSFLSATERSAHLAWQGPWMPVPAAWLHDVIAAHAAQHPDKPAVAHGSVTLTYRELDRQGNRLARYLQGLGVGPDVPVGVCVTRSPQMVVAILAVLKAGGAFMPLDPAYPAERLGYMLEDARLPVLVTEQRVVDLLPSQWATTVVIDGTDRDDWLAAADEPLAVALAPENLAYIIYTSGSTGRPKGTLLHHGGLSNLIAAQAETFGANADRVGLQFASLSFDASVFELCLALGVGGTLCLGSRESLLPGPALVTLLRQHRVDTITVPPSVCLMLPPDELPDLRTVIVAGEACPSELVARWVGDHDFFNAYGPTETTVWASTARCQPGEAPTIGRPILNGSCHIVDAGFEPVPIGVAGELLVGGSGVGRGYLRRPDLTADRFVPDPFSAPPGARLYRTGDRARYRASGEIEFLGRRDDQVKVRGHRIELGEIEAAVRQCPGVQECAALVRTDSRGDGAVVVYVAWRDGAALSGAEVRQRLREKLPEFMIPAAVVAVAALPRTPNGKLDRRALPQPTAEAASEQVEPASELEHRILKVWHDVLQRDDVGVATNFFDCGGHSLLLAHVHLRLTELLRCELSLVDLFQHPTVRALAAHLVERYPATLLQA